jgi:predicted nucleotidyltransferase
MSDSKTVSLDLPDEYLEPIRKLLRTHVPHVEVWAYGSRVRGGGHEASDLDLVLRDPAAQGAEVAGLAEIKEAFIESDLPIRVDIVDWARLPEAFRREIERAHVVIQVATLGP